MSLAFYLKTRGRRTYLVHKPLSLTDRIAAASNIKGNWDEVMRARRGTREIRNFKT